MENKDVVVARTDPKKRAEIEARRGVVRDAAGKIVRSDEWRKERVAHLKAKKEGLMQRVANVDAEIAEREAELLANGAKA